MTQQVIISQGAPYSITAKNLPQTGTFYAAIMSLSTKDRIEATGILSGEDYTFLFTAAQTKSMPVGNVMLEIYTKDSDGNASYLAFCDIFGRIRNSSIKSGVTPTQATE